MIRILFKKMLDEKSFRENRRITINEVCEVTGLSRATVSKIANTHTYKMNTETLDILCEYFECQPGELLEWVKETDGRN